jgi:hypothetical protein
MNKIISALAIAAAIAAATSSCSPGKAAQDDKGGDTVTMADTIAPTAPADTATITPADTATIAPADTTDIK